MSLKSEKQLDIGIGILVIAILLFVYSVGAFLFRHGVNNIAGLFDVYPNQVLLFIAGFLLNLIYKAGFGTALLVFVTGFILTSI